MRNAVLVTGASRGIGRAVADRLLEDGYQVVNLDLQAPEHSHPNEQHYQLDVSDEAALRLVLTRVLEDGPITRLVNNAGIVRPATIDDTSLQDMRAVMDVNLGASIVCTQMLLPGMKEAGFGRIVNISSRAALGKTKRIVYSSSKAALHGFTKTLALEVGAFGVTVNAVGPGPIATELFNRVNPPDAPSTQRILDAIPVKRVGQPADVAHQVASFLDARAGFITGQVIYVCGGMTVGLAE